MKVVLQRVNQAHVKVAAEIVGQIRQGMLVFVSVGKKDSKEDADQLIQKIIQLRMFDDSEGKMNLSALETGAEILVVSQFTLHGDCAKGRRPSFDKAAATKDAEELYNYFVERLREEKLKVETGLFQMMMEVALVNSGPVTFMLESKSENL